MRRCPVICRVDGKSFHSFTKGFKKPFDELLIQSMQETMKYLCENIQGCVLGYQQSDEISLLLIDYKTFESQAFFDYEVQKICSITASMATMAFNRFLTNNYQQWIKETIPEDKLMESSNLLNYKEELILSTVYFKAIDKGAMFDARCFNIPREEVTNYFYWRQLDATRNSIQMVGQANFSHKELQNKSCNEIQDMLHEQRGINWNDFPVYQKRGSCCIKVNELVNDTIRGKWIIDKKIPIFKDNGREYIDQYVLI